MKFSKKEDSLCFPRVGYGPISLKILEIFMDHFKIPMNMEVPGNGDTGSVIMSKVLTIMLEALPKEKKESIYKICEDYLNSVDKNLR